MNVAKTYNYIDTRPRSISEVAVLRDKGVPGYVVWGDFLDAFYEAAPEQRQSFLEPEPPRLKSIPKAVYAYYAASAEHLARKYALNVPGWTESSDFFLSESEADYAGRTPHEASTAYQEALQSEAPYPFARRNVFVSANVLSRG